MCLPREVAASHLLHRIKEEIQDEKDIVVSRYNQKIDLNDEKSRLLIMTNKNMYKLFIVTKIKENIKEVGAIIIDEANLRLAHGDILMSFYKKMVEYNPDLKLILLCNSDESPLYNRFYENIG